MILCVKDLIYKVDECIGKKTFSDGAVLNIVNLVQSCVLVGLYFAIFFFFSK